MENISAGPLTHYHWGTPRGRGMSLPLRLGAGLKGPARTGTTFIWNIILNWHSTPEIYICTCFPPHKSPQWILCFRKMGIVPIVASSIPSTHTNWDPSVKTWPQASPTLPSTQIWLSKSGNSRIPGSASFNQQLTPSPKHMAGLFFLLRKHRRPLFPSAFDIGSFALLSRISTAGLHPPGYCSLHTCWWPHPHKWPLHSQTLHARSHLYAWNFFPTGLYKYPNHVFPAPA